MANVIAAFNGFQNRLNTIRTLAKQGPIDTQIKSLIADAKAFDSSVANKNSYSVFRSYLSDIQKNPLARDKFDPAVRDAFDGAFYSLGHAASENGGHLNTTSGSRIRSGATGTHVNEPVGEVDGHVLDGLGNPVRSGGSFDGSDVDVLGNPSSYDNGSFDVPGSDIFLG